MGKENKRNRDAVEVFFQQLYTHQQDKGMIMNNFPSAWSGEMQTEWESKFRENIQKFLEYIIIELWQTLQAYDDFHNPNKKKSQIGKTKETTITDILAILEKSSLGRE